MQNVMDTVQCLLFFAVSLLIVGLPAPDLLGGLLIAGSFILFVCLRLLPRGPVKKVAWGLLLLGLCFRFAPPDIPIEEGHHMLLAKGDEREPLAQELPEGVFPVMRTQFALQFPPELRPPASEGRTSWTSPYRSFTPRLFAFSAEGLWKKPRYSRIVSDIRWKEARDLRFGFLNQISFSQEKMMDMNWGDDPSPHHLDRNHFPFYVFYEFPAVLVGQELCWEGHLLVPDGARYRQLFSNATERCEAIQAGWLGKKVFGLSILRDAPLSMRLKLSGWIKFVVQLKKRGTRVVILWLLFVVWMAAPLFSARGATWRFCAFSMLAAALWGLYHVDFLGAFNGLRVLGRGEDGLAFESMARGMAFAFARGDWRAVISGTEPVFFYTPSYRYLLFLAKFLFGETFLIQSFVYLSFLCALVFVLRIYTSALWAAICFSVFIFAKNSVWLLEMGWNAFAFRQLALDNFSDTYAYAFLLSAIGYLAQRLRRNDTRNFLPGLIAGFLFALTAFARPNLLPCACAAFAVVVLYTGLRKVSFRFATAMAVGLCFVLVIPLHNYIFQTPPEVPFVFLTRGASSPDLLLATPGDYLQGFLGFFGADVKPETYVRINHAWGYWKSGPFPWRTFSIIVPIVGGLGFRRFHPAFVLLCAVTLAQHLSLFFYRADARYAMPAWLLATLCCLVAFYNVAQILLKRSEQWRYWSARYSLLRRI